jgi:TRAP-type C4-dicarboxylate transport system substrate-binding protein
VIPSLSKAIHGVEDFKGMRIRTSGSPVAQASLRELGAIPVPMGISDSHDAIQAGKIDAAETTYIRVNAMVDGKAKYLNETFHSLFLTSILASDKFYQSLSKENREALTRAALAAARIERQDSIDDGVKVKAAFEKSGVKVVNLAPAQDKALRKRLKKVYGRFDGMFEKGLVKDIVATK